MQIMTTTLWEYPSQHYDAATGNMQGDKRYVGASPSWVIWQCLQRYTKPGETVLDPMVGSGTTIDVAMDLKRRAIGFDLAPSRPDIRQGDARKIDLPSASVDFVFVDPPYSTHVDYSDDPACIGKLDALGADGGGAYYASMQRVIREIARVLKPGRHMALYVSDSFQKPGANSASTGFAPIGFELFAMMRESMQPVDIIAVVRHNQKLQRGNWHKAAEEGNFFLRGFNYLFIMRKM
ncbi:MAG: methyltransferase domain-containing protein [Phycisphaeraceae bacterium]|nr:methyltransferase domain-containing protein [Phycisphaeraceae bacterium]